MHILPKTIFYKYIQIETLVAFMNGATHGRELSSNVINGSHTKKEGMMSYTTNTSLPLFSGVAGNEHRFPN
jgi:hypothetical protein